MNTALVIIDVQNDYFSQGKCELFQAEQANDLGYYVTLIADACATKDLEWNGRKLPASFINEVYMASLNGKFAEVITSADYFTEN